MFEPIGLIILAAGLASLAMGRTAPMVLVVLCSGLGAAAALLIGSANIQPAHVVLLLAVAAMVARPEGAAFFMRTLASSPPAVWLLLLVVYGVTTAYFIPRLMAGATDIVPLGASAFDDTGDTVPLGPVSSNFTQSVYMTANLFCFVATLHAASSDKGFRLVALGLLGLAGFNAALAVVDVATYWTGTQALLDPIRNARYTLHHEEQIAGLKRIVGGMPEASAFARFTLGLMAFSAMLWMSGLWTRASGLLALASFALVLLSTSTTGMVGLIPVAGVLYAAAAGKAFLGRPTGQSVTLVAVLPAVAAAIGLVLLASEELRTAILDYLDLLVFSKASSNSGLERAAFNAIALQNFRDSYGFGVGLGTVRTSSLPIALLSHVGIPGTLFYLGFLAAVAWPRRQRMEPLRSGVRAGALIGCFALICGDLIAAPNIEQGLIFYVLAGLAAARPARKTVPALPPPVPVESGERAIALSAR